MEPEKTWPDCVKDDGKTLGRARRMHGLGVNGERQ